MSKFVLDTKKVLTEYTYASYNTKYWLYDKENVSASVKLSDELFKPESKAVENTNNSCFANMSSNFITFASKYNKTPNRIMFIVHPKQHTKVRLDKKEIERWIKECKVHKLMPRGIGALFLKTMYFIIKPENLNMQQIYLYLMSARYIQEEPYFIKTLFYLLDEGVDFWIAICASCTMTAANAGHGYLPVYKNYNKGRGSYDPNKEKFNLNFARQLRKFVMEGEIEKYSSPMKEAISKYLKNKPANSYSYFTFNFHNGLQKIPLISNLTGVSTENLKDPEIVKLVNT